jgi:hypothetical protein
MAPIINNSDNITLKPAAIFAILKISPFILSAVPATWLAYHYQPLFIFLSILLNLLALYRYIYIRRAIYRYPAIYPHYNWHPLQTHRHRRTIPCQRLHHHPTAAPPDPKPHGPPAQNNRPRKPHPLAPRYTPNQHHRHPSGSHSPVPALQ